MSHFKKLASATLFLTTLAGVSTIAQAQDWSAYKRGGLLMHNDVLEQTTKSGSRENSVGMNGHILIFQPDNNLCVNTSPGMKWKWCVSDEGADYRKIRKVIFQNGQLKALDGNGNPVWQSFDPEDNDTRLVISETGDVISITRSGAKNWIWGRGNKVPAGKY